MTMNNEQKTIKNLIEKFIAYRLLLIVSSCKAKSCHG